MRLTAHLKLTSYSGRTFVLLATSCLPLLAAGAVSAQITIATVPVGNPGNAADTTGFGSVNYNYNIGEYDVTSSQYTAFLNAVAASDPYDAYESIMADTTSTALSPTPGPGIVQSGSSGSYTYSVVDGLGNYPMCDVSFWDACRFANWLDNGQPTGAEGPGTTETGTYTLTSTGITNNTVTRNPGSTWAVTSENEWYKAAYYSPTLNGGAGGYWLYPTQSNTISTTQANYGQTVGPGNYFTPVGSYPYPSYYGTYDQGGDVEQWNESIYELTAPQGEFPSRGYRGGSFDDPAFTLESSENDSSPPAEYGPETGFRVVNVPEPASLGILVLGATGMLVRRRSIGQ
jgi:formylglycine-generating enzyme